MTQGYPDFLRVSQRIGAPLANTSLADVDADTSLGPFYVGTWPAVQVAIGVSGVTVGTVGLVWLTAQTGGDTIATEDYLLTTNTSLSTQRTVLGPWLRIDLSQVTALGASWSVLIVPTSNVDPVSPNVGDPELISTPVTTLEASGSDVWVADRLRPGPAVLAFLAGGDGFTVQLQAVDSAGDFAMILQVALPTGVRTAVNTVYLPRRIVQALVTNSSTTAHGYAVSLITQ